ncbi:MAG: tqsA 2 [Planctomycetota bacterium]|nr:tqsA 2 [Planctomycetota bacterium]
MSEPPPPAGDYDRSTHTPTNAVRLIAIVVAGAAMYWTASILAPFFIGVVLAIAMSPLARRLERLGANRTIASLACMLLVALVIVAVGGLIFYQAGTMLKKGDVYVERLGELSAKVMRTVGGESWLRSLSPRSHASQSAAMSRDAEPESLVAHLETAIRNHADEIGRWAAAGVGGLLGLLGNTVLVLAFLFYLLQGRDDWIDRLKRAAKGLGMQPRDHEFVRVASDVKHYLGALLLVSASYAVVISAAMWLIGVPQPFFWGMLTGILEFVPFFGPVLAGTLSTLAALGAGGSWWQPLAVVAVFLVVGMVEGYVVTPILYGKSVDIDPVTVLLGVMFFGFLLGPAGLALAMSMMIILRGILIITPDTPALDALADAKSEEVPV